VFLFPALKSVNAAKICQSNPAKSGCTSSPEQETLSVSGGLLLNLGRKQFARSQFEVKKSEIDESEYPSTDIGRMFEHL